VRIAGWQAGGFDLPAATVDEVPTPPLAQRLGIGGLIGSDVLSRFGAVTVDFVHGRLRLGLDAAQALGPSALRVPVRIVRHGATVVATATASVDGGGPFTVLVDTGAAQSVIDAPLARSEGLPVVSLPRPVEGVSCAAAESTVEVPSWRVGAVDLPGQDMAALDMSPPGNDNGIHGLLGADTLSRFGTVVLDYAHGQLLLARPAA
jgi:hypothetical protein